MSPSHLGAAIAQTVLYMPMPVLSLYICIRNTNLGNRLAWYPLVPFALTRLGGGALAIVARSKPPANLADFLMAVIADMLLKGGLVPLTISYFGLACLVLKSSFKDSRAVNVYTAAIRISIFTSIGWMAFGGIFKLIDVVDLLMLKETTVTELDLPMAHQVLAKGALINLALTLASLVCEFLMLYVNRKVVQDQDFVYVKYALMASPLLLVPVVYGLLGVFDSMGVGPVETASIWSPLFGSAPAFSFMLLLPEWIILCVILYLGLVQSRKKHRLIW